MAQQPWWSFPRIDNFGQIDPQGNYWKPDTNILTPPGYPVAAILPGTVTSVQRTSWGQSVVTIKLDSPLNALATHTFYEHMHDATVGVGQHVNQGEIIGNANYAGEGANLGFGLYSGDIYGAGPAWQTLQNDLKPGGAGLLNPIALINDIQQGRIPTTINGAPTINTGNPVIDSALNAVLPQIKTWAEYAAVFLIALILIILGFVLLGGAPALQAAKKAVTA